MPWHFGECVCVGEKGKFLKFGRKPCKFSAVEIEIWIWRKNRQQREKGSFELANIFRLLAIAGKWTLAIAGNVQMVFELALGIG